MPSVLAPTCHAILKYSNLVLVYGIEMHCGLCECDTVANAKSLVH